jgi:hypothetical protein
VKYGAILATSEETVLRFEHLSTEIVMIFWLLARFLDPVCKVAFLISFMSLWKRLMSWMGFLKRILIPKEPRVIDCAESVPEIPGAGKMLSYFWITGCTDVPYPSL